MAYPYVCDPCLDDEALPGYLHDCKEWAGKAITYHFCVCECRGRYPKKVVAEARALSHRERRGR